MWRLNLSLDDKYKDKLDMLSMITGMKKTSIINEVAIRYLEGMESLLNSIGIDINNDSVKEVKEKMKKLDINEMFADQMIMLTNKFNELRGDVRGDET